jgi:LemA protein
VSAGAWLTLALAAVGVFWMLGAYNRLVALRNAIGSAWQQVDAALAQRAEAVAALAAALGDDRTDDRTDDREGARADDTADVAAALGALRAAQAQVATAADALRPRPVLADRARALEAAETAMAAACADVLARLDARPDLRAADPVAAAAAALRDAGARLVFARLLFNDAVQAYDDAVSQWPTRLLARLYGFGAAGRL